MASLPYIPSSVIRRTFLRVLRWVIIIPMQMIPRSTLQVIMKSSKHWADAEQIKVKVISFRI